VSPRTDLVSGPDQYWSDGLEPSRGQWKDIAQVACEVLGLDVPTTRLEATVVMVRLRAAAEQRTPPPAVPEAW